MLWEASASLGGNLDWLFSVGKPVVSFFVCARTAVRIQAVHWYAPCLIAAYTLMRSFESTLKQYAVTLACLRLIDCISSALLSRRVFMDLHDAFSRFDENGDGSISREEFKQVCASAHFVVFVLYCHGALRASLCA